MDLIGLICGGLLANPLPMRKLDAVAVGIEQTTEVANDLARIGRWPKVGMTIRHSPRVNVIDILTVVDGQPDVLTRWRRVSLIRFVYQDDHEGRRIFTPSQPDHVGIIESLVDHPHRAIGGVERDRSLNVTNL